MKTINSLALCFMLGMGYSFSQKPHHTLDMRIQHAPDVVTIDGKPTIYYELLLTNIANESVAVKKIEIIDPADSTLVFSVSNDDLRKRYAGEPSTENDT